MRQRRAGAAGEFRLLLHFYDLKVYIEYWAEQYTCHKMFYDGNIMYSKFLFLSRCFSCVFIALKQYIWYNICDEIASVRWLKTAVPPPHSERRDSTAFYV